MKTSLGKQRHTNVTLGVAAIVAALALSGCGGGGGGGGEPNVDPPEFDIHAAVPGQPVTGFAVALGQPEYGGTACPLGTVSATLSPDAKSLSLLFDKYQVEVGGTTGKSFDRKSCNLAIPVHVPKGMSVSALKIDFRGFNHLPQSASSQFNVEYFLANSRGPALEVIFNGTLNEDFFINNELTVQPLIWSGCGADVNLRTNSSLSVKTVANNEAMSSIDSEDVSGGIIYQLQWRGCN